MNSMLPGLPRAWRGPGANFFRGPYFKNFYRKKIFGQQPPPPPCRQLYFPNEYVVIAFNCFFQFFIPNFGTLPNKNPISCPLHRNISPKKMTGAQQKISRGPQNLGAQENPPPLPPSPPPLGSPVGYCI